LRYRDGDVHFTLFADGRAIVQGTADPDRARTIYARFVGS
jgi:adenylyltransferase/sulfurtransferase